MEFWLLVLLFVTNLVWLIAWIYREKDTMRERYFLLERIQRPERVPVQPQFTTDDIEHPTPDPELALVGQIDPPLSHRDDG